MAQSMKYRLYAKGTDQDDKPFATLNGRIEGADEGDVAITYKGRVFTYADTDGETFVDFREAQTVFDATSSIDDTLEREGQTIGG